MHYRTRIAGVAFIFFFSFTPSTQAGEGLVAHWKLRTNTKDSSAGGHHAVNHGVRFENGSAVFNGLDTWMEVPVSKSLKLGRKEFSIAAWVHTDELLDDVLGDVITCYDPAARKGLVRGIVGPAMIIAGLAAVLVWRYVLQYSGSIYEVLPGMAAGFLVYGIAQFVVTQFVGSNAGEAD